MSSGTTVGTESSAESLEDGSGYPITPAAGSRTRRSMPPSLRAGAPAWIWIGIAVAAVGFGLIALGWGQVAGETQVYLQLPYLVSASVVGLALVMVGVMTVNVAARQRDGQDRDQQVAQLITILEELQDALEGRDR